MVRRNHRDARRASSALSRHSHPQTIRTRQPSALSSLASVLSLARLRSKFGSQKSVRVVGGRPLGHLWPCTPANVFADLRIDAATASQATGEIAFYESDCKRPQNVPDRQWTLRPGRMGARRLSSWLAVHSDPNALEEALWQWRCHIVQKWHNLRHDQLSTVKDPKVRRGRKNEKSGRRRFREEALRSNGRGAPLS